jgi:hypothetical protein
MTMSDILVVPPEFKQPVLVSSHQDLQRRLEESGAVNRKTALMRQGLVERLFEAFFKLLTSLVEAARPLDNVTLEDKQKFQNELERLFLWGEGFGAGDESLDDSLDKSTELKINILSLLSQLGKIVTQSMLWF